MKIWVAIPAFDEEDFLPQTVSSIIDQTETNFEVVICVNQPDSWWNKEEKLNICLNNQRTIKYLQELHDERFRVIDRSSRGHGFDDKRSGVGWARKTLCDWIVKQAEKDDIIIFTDADTTFDKEYFADVANCFNCDKQVIGVVAPYYHKLTGNDAIDKAILRYELYMRCYGINMCLINSKYSPTAIGSAISVRCGSYKSVGGITPYRSGEDFYFIQKLIKFGKVSTHCKSKVYPASRLSERVDFGTGPAMIRGIDGDWASYPIYHSNLFNEIKDTFDTFSQLFDQDIEMTMSPFLRKQLSESELWEPLRRNFKTRDKFVRACKEKVDGLRIFQYLKSRQKVVNISDNTAINDLLSKLSINRTIDIEKATIAELNEIRNQLSTALSRLENQRS